MYGEQRLQEKNINGGSKDDLNNFLPTFLIGDGNENESQNQKFNFEQYFNKQNISNREVMNFINLRHQIFITLKIKKPKEMNFINPNNIPCNKI
jgi:hypothetical protein